MQYMQKILRNGVLMLLFSFLLKPGICSLSKSFFRRWTYLFLQTCKLTGGVPFSISLAIVPTATHNDKHMFLKFLAFIFAPSHKKICPHGVSARGKAQMHSFAYRMWQ